MRSFFCLRCLGSLGCFYCHFFTSFSFFYTGFAFMTAVKPTPYTSFCRFMSHRMAMTVEASSSCYVAVLMIHVFGCSSENDCNNSVQFYSNKIALQNSRSMFDFTFTSHSNNGFFPSNLSNKSNF